MAEEGDLRINGKVYDPNTMTFREQREMKRIIRDELFADEVLDEESLGLADILPAMAVVLVRRDSPGYTLEEALELVPHEVLVAETDTAPPTSRGSSRSSRATPSRSTKKPTPATPGSPA